MARVDRGLAQLILEWKAEHPGALVGTQGDDHHTPPSDHLPDAADTIDAADFMKGKGGVTDVELDDLRDRLYASRDNRIAYIIRRDKICSSTVQPWVWRDYDGEYHGHVHLSVNEAHADDPREWDLFDMTPKQFTDALLVALDDDRVETKMRALSVSYTGGGIPKGKSLLNVINDLHTMAVAGGSADASMATGLSGIRTKIDGVTEAVGYVQHDVAGLPDEILTRLGSGRSAVDVAALLRQVPGVDWAAVGRALNA